MFKFEIETYNTAFQGGQGHTEIMRIFTKAISQYQPEINRGIEEVEDAEPMRYPLRDINGNKVGFVEFGV